MSLVNLELLGGDQSTLPAEHGSVVVPTDLQRNRKKLSLRSQDEVT